MWIVFSIILATLGFLKWSSSLSLSEEAWTQLNTPILATLLIKSFEITFRAHCLCSASKSTSHAFKLLWLETWSVALLRLSNTTQSRPKPRLLNLLCMVPASPAKTWPPLRFNHSSTTVHRWSSDEHTSKRRWAELCPITDSGGLAFCLPLLSPLWGLDASKRRNLYWQISVVSPPFQTGNQTVSFTGYSPPTKGDVTRKTYSFVSGTAGVESLVTLIQGHIHYRITHTTFKYFVPIPLDSVRTWNCSGLNKIGLKSDRLIW